MTTLPQAPTITPTAAPNPGDDASVANTQRATRWLRASRGMTLVEIMIVVAIMASIASVAAFYTVGYLNNAKIKEAEAEVANLAQMVETYYAFSETYPDNLDQLKNPPGGMSPLTRDVPNDPWGADYEYSKSGDQGFEIFSKGPDGRAGSDDDIYPGGRGDR